MRIEKILPFFRYAGGYSSAIVERPLRCIDDK